MISSSLSQSQFLLSPALETASFGLGWGVPGLTDFQTRDPGQRAGECTIVAIRKQGATTATPVGQLLSDEQSAFDLEFRNYRLIPGARLLLREGDAVRLGSRAFDLLHILLRSRGKLVTKEEIVEHVWPSTTVEESNLRFQMGCLRKALGADRDLIKTIPGRGYVLATDISVRRECVAAE